MQVPDQIFRTYDIRGKFPDPFSPEVVLNLGRAIGLFSGNNRIIAIGRDVRGSSPLITSLLSAGLMETGCNVLDVGICTTPTIYFLAARNKEINGGTMVTASHNPIDYNGIKVCNEKGVAFHFENFYSQIKETIKRNQLAILKDIEYGQPVSLKGIDASQYWEFQEQKFQPARILNIAVDIGNGTCYPIIKLLKKKKFNVHALHPEPNGKFPVMIPDPAKSSCLQYLQNKVIQEKLDIGIGFDADGDRVGFVDNKGEIISPDQVIMLYSKDLLQKRPNSEIMVDVKTSRATFEYLTMLGAKLRYTRVGHSWIHEGLLKTNAIFAGELSGHYYFGVNYYGFDDAIYSALRMLEILSSNDHPLSKIIQNLPKYPASEEIRVPCLEKVISTVVSNLKSLLIEEAQESIVLDGIRAEFNDGWILVRKSGTEPVISIRVEAENSNKLDYYQKYALELVDTEVRKAEKKVKN
ncbi:MAG: phosphomannomutase/phosphoglucomutase [Candidatus Hodarchaeota archaeon]